MKCVSVEHLSNEELIAHAKRIASDERRATAALIAALGEIDTRRLYLAEGCSSLFTYSTRVLHLSEHAAYGRIEAARSARRFPIMLELFATGEINLTTITLLASHLTPDNHRAILEAARHKSKREVEHLVAALRPQPDVPSSIRKLPALQQQTKVASDVEQTVAWPAARVPPAASPPPVVKPLHPNATRSSSPSRERPMTSWPGHKTFCGTR